MTAELNLDGASILVTGGTGSFGQAFVRHVLAKHKPRRLIVFSRDETKQHEMATALSPETHPCLRYFIGDVRDFNRVEMATKSVDYIVHAAALKYVPTAEYNPLECINTNITGSENIIRAAMRNGVRKVMMISTDKAAGPANLYGATKLCGEKIMIAANNLSGEGGTKFSVARYGNVVGSRGSVVPFFDTLIRNGVGELPITDERMTRFWIKLADGVKLVLTSMAMMHGGEIFVPKLQATRVVDIARVMAPELPTKIVGIRPGEKIHESLLSPEEVRQTYDVGDRYVVHPALSFWNAEANGAGERLPEDFEYMSGNPDLLMPLDDLKALIDNVIEPRRAQAA